MAFLLLGQSPLLQDEYTTDHVIGQDNIQPLGLLDVHNPVFLISGTAIVLFVVFTLSLPDSAAQTFGELRPWLTTTFDWVFMTSVNFFVVFLVFIACTKAGHIRIGGVDCRPDFSFASWISMLFAAGIGIGIMFYGVLEPMNHLLTPPLNGGELDIEGQRQLAMAATLYHWALHPWAVYTVLGLSLAFFAYNKGLPLIIRSALYPLFGERIWGWTGHIIDVLAVIATLFGLATSLGYGAEQITGGLSYLFGISGSDQVKAIVVGAITIMAMISLVRGLDGGIKRLSEINMIAAGILGAYVLFMGPTLDIIAAFFGNVVAYIQYLPALSNFVGREDAYYMHDWTTFYWSWWIAFSPFVGMFIARISKGRTVREFIIATLLAPSLIFVAWMTIFGETAMNHYLDDNITAVADTVRAFQPELTLFVFLQEFPLATVSCVLGIFLVMVFFTTSMDSGAFIVDTMTSGGKIETPIVQRLFWCVFLGLIGIALLLGGGLSSLQALSLATGFPFCLILLLMCISLYKGLFKEAESLAAAKS